MGLRQQSVRLLLVSPTQAAPPHDGVGLLQERKRVRVPQVRSYGPHAVYKSENK